ncbi:MAG: 3-isopropylmalate dehydratase large subunit [Candidatus Marinimicrobia bacterium]|nr:3-isopropylmalate dehydratase large subunit [Candidatus Neomarinimicrobiota bacterium]
MGKTFSEKILGKKAGKPVVAGEIVEIEPDVAMSHDNTAAISQSFYEIGVDKVYNPDMHVVILDHATPAANSKFAQNHKDIREFVAKQGIKNFYDVNVGICHQVMHEQGHVWPGAVIVGSDSHTTSYGAYGAFSAGIGRSEMAVIMARGKIWLRVPETIKIHVAGKLPAHITAKDLVLKIAKEIGADGALYKAIEFCGPTIEQMSLSGRFVLANMAAELGAKNGYVAPDEKTLEYIKSVTDKEFEIVMSDDDAEFDQIVNIDVTNLEPMIAKPHTVDNVCPVSEVKGTKIHQVFFGSCTNGRYEDFEDIIDIIDGRKIHPAVRMLVFPASMKVYKQILQQGWVEKLVDFGAVVMNPGCGPCMGNHAGILADGEICVATSNRNFKGRLGNNNAFVYLASPRTAAWCAVKGEIADFREM